MKLEKLLTKVITVSILAVLSNAQAAPMQLLSGPLANQTVFAHTYVSGGAGPNIVASGQTVFGNILANQDITLGDSAEVSGNTQSRDLTTGDGAIIGGNVTTVGDSTIGANAVVSGNLKSVDSTLGANATIAGNVVTVADITLGDNAKISGTLQSGKDVTIGANASVVGTLQYGRDLTVSANNASTGTISQNTTPSSATVIADVHLGVSATQTALNAMTGGSVLATGDIATSRTFTSGVYDVTGLLTTTAGITLTLNAQGQDSSFIFNVSNYLSFGAGTIIDLINETENASIVWNSHGAGGYTSIGANAKIMGVILATTYVSLGASSSVTGPGSSCGGVFSATSYVSLGANSSVGGKGCSGLTSVSAVPLPAAIWLFGSGLIGLIGMARRKKA